MDKRAEIMPSVNEPGGLIKALHKLQDLSGHNFLSPQDIELAAEVFNIPVASVWGSVTFYSMFSTTPRGRHVIRVCESAPCHVVGAMNIVEALEKTLNIKVGETTKDGRFTLELASCLGVCGVAPAMMINQNVHGNLTVDNLRDSLNIYV